MNRKKDIGQYLTTIIKSGAYSTESKLKFHMESIFHDIDFNDKTVLDIGGGTGLYSFYAVFMGAKKVINLEPEDMGSSSGMVRKFEKLSKSLNAENAVLENKTLQEFDPGDQKFDIILLYNSINHLNEKACITLLDDEGSRAIYKDLFEKIYSLSARGGKIIICDCSNKNFFASLKTKNYFAPDIEWEKHQAPEVWAKLLKDAGFVNPRISWSSFNSLGKFGKYLTANKPVSYFLNSHFCLKMEKP